MNENICDLLASLPPNYPVAEYIVDGNGEAVESFVGLDSERNLAYFTAADGSLNVADCSRISSIEFPPA